MRDTPGEGTGAARLLLCGIWASRARRQVQRWSLRYGLFIIRERGVGRFPGGRCGSRRSSRGGEDSFVPGGIVVTGGGPRVNDHPTPEELEGMAWNCVSAGRMREILLHVLSGCAACRSAMAPHFGALF